MRGDDTQSNDTPDSDTLQPLLTRRHKMSPNKLSTKHHKRTKGRSTKHWASNEQHDSGLADVKRKQRRPSKSAPGSLGPVEDEDKRAIRNASLPNVSDAAFRSPTAPLTKPLIPHRQKNISLLNSVKPENQATEKLKFMDSKYKYNPHFVYRFPPDEKRLDKYSRPSDKYLPQAVHILRHTLRKYGTCEKMEQVLSGRVLKRPEIYKAARTYIEDEKLDNEIHVKMVEDLVPRAMMVTCRGRNTLKIRSLGLRENHVIGMLRHEIGTHYMRSSNNALYPWKKWRRRKKLNMLHYNPTEEGLASLHSVIFHKDPVMWRAAILYYATWRAAELSFSDLFKDLGQFVRSIESRWDYCLRVKRGMVDTSQPGSFCKDQVYLDGALQLLRLRHEIDFHLLVRLGKVSYLDVTLLGDCVADETRIPGFMRDLDAYRAALDNIVQANGLTDKMLNGNS